VPWLDEDKVSTTIQFNVVTDKHRLFKLLDDVWVKTVPLWEGTYDNTPELALFWERMKDALLREGIFGDFVKAMMAGACWDTSPCHKVVCSGCTMQWWAAKNLLLHTMHLEESTRDASCAKVSFRLPNIAWYNLSTPPCGRGWCPNLLLPSSP
jgi:hypothetical protein